VAGLLQNQLSHLELTGIVFHYQDAGHLSEFDARDH
jgi:hypothetical protein